MISSAKFTRGRLRRDAPAGGTTPKAYLDGGVDIGAGCHQVARARHGEWELVDGVDHDGRDVRPGLRLPHVQIPAHADVIHS